MVVGGLDLAEAEEGLEDGEEEEEEDTTTALVKYTVRGYKELDRKILIKVFSYDSLTHLT